MAESDSDDQQQQQPADDVDDHVWTLVMSDDARDGNDDGTDDDGNDVAHVEELIKKGGKVPAVKVHICVKDATVIPTEVLKAMDSVPLADVLKPVVKGVNSWTSRAVGHHFTVVEFRSEVVPGSGKRFLRIDRLIHMDAATKTETGLGFDRAELISSMDGMKVYKNHSFKLKTDSSGCAVFGDVLGCWLELHHTNPRYNEGAGVGILRQKGSLNCQGFAEELVKRLRQSHASIFRRAFAKVDNSSHAAAAGARVKRLANTAVRVLNDYWVSDGDEGSSSTGGAGNPAAQGSPSASNASNFTKNGHMKRAALHLKQPRLA